VITTLVPTLTPRPDPEIPTLATLKETDPAFFRRGQSGSHRDELPDDLHALFWSAPGSRAAMSRLGLE
jgi:hypothetical protein